MGRERVALIWDPGLCRHCFGCIAMCQRNALGVDEAGNLSYQIRRCIRCCSCVQACPNGALQAVRLTEE